MSRFSRRTDIGLALLVGLVLFAATFIVGDAIYLGIWYYLIAWAGLLGLVQLGKAPPLFTTGAASALAATFVFYWAWQRSLPEPDGLLGLGHLFSLPGLGIAALVAGVLARLRGMNPTAAFAAGVLSCTIGFAIAQFLICRTVMYCGPLSGNVG